jgi:tetratricopeptide (TPR) repeat protein
LRDQVFISYSHRDAHWLDRLQVYLAPLERRGSVRRWDDTLIASGQRWEREITEALQRARVAVLLVSAEFLASDFISRVELPNLLGAAEDQGVLILPVVLDHCNFDRVPELAQFQAISPPARPLETLSESEQKAVLAKLAAAVEDALADRTGTGSQPARLVGVPARNPLFTGRDAVLDALATALARTGRAAVCGLPGLGKTETAIEFAHRRRFSYRWVCWLRADSEEQIVRGFCAIAAAFGLPESQGADQPAAAKATLAALAGSGNCLLVLDAAEDLQLVRPWIPAGERVHVVMTTRATAVGGLAEPIELESLSEQEGLAFLLHRARLSDPDQALPAPTMQAAREIVRMTEGVPLALDQAGAYLEETGCTVEEYTSLWTEHSLSLMAERGQGSLREGESLLQSWTFSLEQLRKAQPAAVDLLRLFAFFHCDALPEAPLAKGAAFAGAGLGTALADPIKRNALLREALRFAFVRRDAKTRRLHMHRLVQQFLRGSESPETQSETCARALSVLDAGFPEARFVNWPECDALSSHAVSVLDHAGALAIASPAAARLSGELAYYLCQRARYAEAEPRIVRALELRRREPAADTLSRALMIDAQVHICRSRLSDARQRLTEAAGLLGTLPPGVELVRVLDMLASVELARDDMAAAESRLNEALKVAETAGARESAEAAQCFNDLGALRFRRGDYANSRTAFEQAASLRRSVLPPQHPGIAQSLNNVAVVCMRLGERAAARASYAQALALRESALGSDHPYVAETLLNLGLLELKDGQFAAARAALTRAIDIQHACRGRLHLAFAKGQACLADVALAEGHLDEAQSLYEDAHAIRVQLLGVDHTECAMTIVGLADVALARGNKETAAALFAQALPVLRRQLGPSHPDVLACERDLASLRPIPPSSAA